MPVSLLASMAQTPTTVALGEGDSPELLAPQPLALHTSLASAQPCFTPSVLAPFLSPLRETRAAVCLLAKHVAKRNFFKYLF